MLYRVVCQTDMGVVVGWMKLEDLLRRNWDVWVGCCHGG